MKIALFDYKVVPTNPVGSCHLKMLRALAKEHSFTVFAVEFENPCPGLIEWVRIPAPPRPLAVLFTAYHILAPVIFALYCRRRRVHFDLVQMVESNMSFGDVSYSHFSHRTYLSKHWDDSPVPGLRGLFRLLDHRLHAIAEPFVYRKVKRIVVPSRGLAEELASEYTCAAGKLHLIYNPVDLGHFQRDPAFDRTGFRRGLGIQENDLCLVFAALGHFERKGLPLIFEAVAMNRQSSAKLVVVGGQADAIRAYEARAHALGITGRVCFSGMQSDIRPYLWAADAFVLASAYEVFPLVALQAAAASLPIIATPVNGVNELVRHKVNGLLAARNFDELSSALAEFERLSPEARGRMAEASRSAVEQFGDDRFLEGWRDFYAAPHAA